jgi:hypothetical protein
MLRGKFRLKLFTTIKQQVHFIKTLVFLPMFQLQPGIKASFQVKDYAISVFSMF